MKILFLSRWLPWPANNGSKLRIYNLLRGLAHTYDVTLLSFVEPGDSKALAPELHALCRQVQVTPWQPYNKHRLRAQLGFFQLAPRSVVDTFAPAMAHLLQQTLAQGDYDLVIASQIDTARYAAYFQGRPALYEEVEIGGFHTQFTQASSQRLRLRYGLTWWKQRRYLAHLLRSFRACTVASAQEQQLVARIVPNYQHIAVIPNSVNVQDYQNAAAQANHVAEPDTLIFTGGFGYHANYDAMVWFLRDVYPLIQAAIPQVRLTITGEHGGRPLPPTTNVTLTGMVDDVRPLVAQSWLSLAPLRYGGGTRLKILEAMALGTPVVATSKGAEGLDVQHGEQILLGDTPEALAAAVIRLCREPNLRQQVAQKAGITVQEKYDWSATLPRFLALVEQVACR